MTRALFALAVGFLAIEELCNALCWIDSAAGVCRW